MTSSEETVLSIPRRIQTFGGASTENENVDFSIASSRSGKWSPIQTMRRVIKATTPRARRKTSASETHVAIPRIASSNERRPTSNSLPCYTSPRKFSSKRVQKLEELESMVDAKLIENNIPIFESLKQLREQNEKQQTKLEELEDEMLKLEAECAATHSTLRTTQIVLGVTILGVISFIAYQVITPEAFAYQPKFSPTESLTNIIGAADAQLYAQFRDLLHVVVEMLPGYINLKTFELTCFGCASILLAHFAVSHETKPVAIHAYNQAEKKSIMMYQNDNVTVANELPHSQPVAVVEKGAASSDPIFAVVHDNANSQQGLKSVHHKSNLQQSSEVTHLSNLMHDGPQSSIPQTLLPHSDECKAGLRFNFLAGSGVAFKPLFDALTEQQQSTFRQFSEDFPLDLKDYFLGKAWTNDEVDVIPDEFNLLRFLQADNFDLRLATSRLLRTLEWRRNNNVEQFKDGPPKCFKQFSKLRIRHFYGFDKQGRPILWERLGEFLGSSTSFFKLSHAEWVDCHTYEFMNLTRLFRESSIQHNKPIMKHIFMGDLRGVKLWPFLKNTPDMTKMARGVEPHFPEIAGPLFMFNAPSYAHKLFSVTKRILDPRVVEKIRVDKNVPEEEFVKIIELDQIPPEYGGRSELVMAHVCE